MRVRIVYQRKRATGIILGDCVSKPEMERRNIDLLDALPCFIIDSITTLATPLF